MTAVNDAGHVDTSISEAKGHLDSAALPIPTAKLAGVGTLQLEQSTDCEVAIVGGGITGALVADALIEAGVDVALIERREIAGGATASNTALLLYELDTSLAELTSRFGPLHANRIYRLCYDAIDDMRMLIASIDGDCGFEMKKSIYLASEPADAGAIREEVRLRNATGIPCEYLDSRSIAARFSFERPGAILSPTAAQLNPVLFTQLMIRRAQTRGLRVFERTAVARCVPTAQGVCLTTDTSQTIRARWVVYATGYEGPSDAPLTTTQTTYAIVSEPISHFDGWWERCLLWETARPYFYLRTTADGRVMLGGEDDDTIGRPSPQALERKSKRLQDKFRAMFPAIEFRAASSWAGVFKSTRDGLPFIGPRGDHPRALFALGYGGNGMTFAMIAARLLRNQVLGHPNPDLSLFSFDR